MAVKVFDNGNGRGFALVTKTFGSYMDARNWAILGMDYRYVHFRENRMNPNMTMVFVPGGPYQDIHITKVGSFWKVLKAVFMDS